MTEKNKPEIVEDTDLDQVQGGTSWGGGVSKNPVIGKTGGTIPIGDDDPRASGLQDTLSHGD